VRLRHTVPARWPGLPPDAVRRLLESFTAALAPRMAREACPDLAHGWIRAARGAP
jgi:hypothetical protein